MSEAAAKAFHEAYERLAPSFNYTTRRESAVPWKEMPEQNRRLMIAVTDEVCRACQYQKLETDPTLFDKDDFGEWEDDDWEDDDFDN